MLGFVNFMHILILIGGNKGKKKSGREKGIFININFTLDGGCVNVFLKIFHEKM